MRRGKTRTLGAPNMGTFNFDFLDLPTDSDPSPERYERYFLEYNKEDWNCRSSGGSFLYIHDDGARFALVVSQHPDYGISLYFSDDCGSCLSVGDRDAFTDKDFVETDDDIFWPRGSFISPKT